MTQRRLIAEAVSTVASRRLKPGQQPALTLTPPTRLNPWTAAARSSAHLTGAIGRAARKLRSGEISCKELVEESLAAAAADDCNAFSVVTADAARLQAVALDEELSQGLHRSFLHGIPISIKDVIDVEGVHTRAGSDAYDELAGADAPAVALLREAGAVFIGKTVPHEFALGFITPQSRNPRDASRVPGGSSGGSAIAVARGMGLASLGTDTRGSIRVPAALCGVVGLKPTFGIVPAGGLVQLAWSMDHVGPITSSVADAALMTDVMAHTVLSTACGVDVAGLRVGVPPDGCLHADEAVLASFTEAVRRISQLTGGVTEVPRPSTLDFNNASAAAIVIGRAEPVAYHRRLGLDRSKYWPQTRDLLAAAESLSAADYLDAQRLRALVAEQMLKVFDEVDVLAMPTSLIPAPKAAGAARQTAMLSRNTTIWSLTGFPAITIPCRPTAAGLPVGLQLVAPPMEEASLIALGTAFEMLEP